MFTYVLALVLSLASPGLVSGLVYSFFSLVLVKRCVTGIEKQVSLKHPALVLFDSLSIPVLVETWCSLGFYLVRSRFIPGLVLVWRSFRSGLDQVSL